MGGRKLLGGSRRIAETMLRVRELRMLRRPYNRGVNVDWGIDGGGHIGLQVREQD